MEQGLIQKATLDGIADAIREQAETNETMQPGEMPEKIRALNVLNGIVPVNKGGTGRSSLDSGKALVGAGTGAVEMRAINNNTTIGPLSEYSNSIATTNAMAYWNGAYSKDGVSNLSKLGNVNVGTWKATPIDVAHGGTDSTTREGAAESILSGGGTSDANAVTGIGFFTYGPGAKNVPDNTKYGTLVQFRGNLDWLTQISLTTDALPHIHVRTNINSSGWSDWQAFFTSREVVPVSSGGTGANDALQALVNLGLSDWEWMDFTASSAADWEKQIKERLLAKVPSGRPFVFNAGWSGHDFGSGIAWKLAGDVVNVIISNPGAAGGVKFWRCAGGTWSDVMLANESRGIVYSATDPGCVNGRIWLKPIS